jgi:hypothetical protein
MPAFFSRVFRNKDANTSKKQSKSSAATDLIPAKPKWKDAWLRTEVAPEEVQDLIRGCAHELKARGGLEIPFATMWWCNACHAHSSDC